jgi:hypothetical protein
MNSTGQIQVDMLKNEQTEPSWWMVIMNFFLLN